MKDYGVFNETIDEITEEIKYEISQLIRNRLTAINKENDYNHHPSTYVEFNVDSDDLDIAVSNLKIDSVIDAISITKFDKMPDKIKSYEKVKTSKGDSYYVENLVSKHDLNSLADET